MKDIFGDTSSNSDESTQSTTSVYTERYKKAPVIEVLKSDIIRSFFDILTNLLTKTNDHLTVLPNFDKFFNPYLLCRYLSMREDLIDTAMKLETVLSITQLSNVEFYNLAWKLIPKRKQYFIHYIKRPAAPGDTLER